VPSGAALALYVCGAAALTRSSFRASRRGAADLERYGMGVIPWEPARGWWLSGKVSQRSRQHRASRATIIPHGTTCRSREPAAVSTRSQELALLAAAIRPIAADRARDSHSYPPHDGHLGDHRPADASSSSRANWAQRRRSHNGRPRRGFDEIVRRGRNRNPGGLRGGGTLQSARGGAARR